MWWVLGFACKIGYDSEAPNAVVISHRHHHSFRYFSGVAQEAMVLQMLHLIIFFMSQNVNLGAEASTTWRMWQIWSVVDFSYITTRTRHRYEFPTN
jgi:hypothetical protein